MPWLTKCAGLPASIGANLFEGSYRTGANEFRYFANIARGSAGEVKYFLLLSRDLGYIGVPKLFVPVIEGVLGQFCPAAVFGLGQAALPPLVDMRGPEPGPLLRRVLL